MENLQQLFDYRLQNMYTAEYDLLDLLQELALESNNRRLRTTFAEQHNQTLRHIKRLERIFKVRGRQPTEIRCPELEGIIRMRRAFAEERPTPLIRDIFNYEVGQKIQNFQISSYENLANLAARLDMPPVVKLLRDNLQEEKTSLYELGQLIRRDGEQQAAEKRPHGKVA